MDWPTAMLILGTLVTLVTAWLGYMRGKKSGDSKKEKPPETAEGGKKVQIDVLKKENERFEEKLDKVEEKQQAHGEQIASFDTDLDNLKEVVNRFKDDARDDLNVLGKRIADLEQPSKDN